jgi:autophagy-related protein 11
MSLQIFTIPAGECIQCPDPVVTSLETLRTWIAKATNIPSEDQILLTARGRHVKLQSLLTDVRYALYMPLGLRTSC